MTFVTRPMTKTCVDQLEHVNAGAKIDLLTICKDESVIEIFSLLKIIPFYLIVAL